MIQTGITRISELVVCWSLPQPLTLLTGSTHTCSWLPKSNPTNNPAPQNASLASWRRLLPRELCPPPWERHHTASWRVWGFCTPGSFCWGSFLPSRARRGSGGSPPGRRWSRSGRQSPSGTGWSGAGSASARGWAGASAAAPPPTAGGSWEQGCAHGGSAPTPTLGTWSPCRSCSHLATLWIPPTPWHLEPPLPKTAAPYSRLPGCLPPPATPARPWRTISSPSRIYAWKTQPDCDSRRSGKRKISSSGRRMTYRNSWNGFWSVGKETFSWASGSVTSPCEGCRPGDSFASWICSCHILLGCIGPRGKSLGFGHGNNRVSGILGYGLWNPGSDTLSGGSFLGCEMENRILNET